MKKTKLLPILFFILFFVVGPLFNSMGKTEYKKDSNPKIVQESTVSTQSTTSSKTFSQELAEEAVSTKNELKNIFKSGKETLETFVSDYKEADANATTTTETSDVIEKLNSLNKVKELPNVSYDRKNYKHWNLLDNGLNVREQVLVDNGSNVVVENDTVISGVWYDWYMDKELTSPKEIDIDHVIPLKLANKMGMESRTPEEKQVFANDFENLVVSYNRLNRAKSDKGPSEWQPEDLNKAKLYATKFIEVAYKYNLTLSQADYDALITILNN